MSEKQNKNVTVRVQKIKKNHIKQKLVFFLILAIGLVILAVFQSISVHMTLMHRIWQVHFSPQSSASYGNRYIWERYAVQSYKWCKSQYFSTFILVAVIFVLGTAVGVCCGYFGGAADTVMMRISDICLAFPGLVFAMAIAAILGEAFRMLL